MAPDFPVKHTCFFVFINLKIRIYENCLIFFLGNKIMYKEGQVVFQIFQARVNLFKLSFCRIFICKF